MASNYANFRQMSQLPRSEDDYTRYSKAIDSRTVKFQLPRGRAFRRYHFVEALKSRIKVEDIETIGTHQNAFVWFATLRSIEAHKKVVEAGRLCINNCEVMPLSMDVNEVNIRVHWLPYNVHNHLLAQALSCYGEVLRIDFERETHDKEISHIRTNVRSVVMRFESQEEYKALPHIMSVRGIHQILLTCKGRRPLCLKCHMEGHVRSKCDTPFCRHCGIYEHRTEDCMRTATYAAALKQRQEQDPPADTDMDPAEHEAEDSEEKEENHSKLFIDTDAEDDEEEKEEKEEPEKEEPEKEDTDEEDEEKTQSRQRTESTSEEQMDITHRKEDTEEDKEEDAHSTQSDIELSAQHTDTNTHTHKFLFFRLLTDLPESKEDPKRGKVQQQPPKRPLPVAPPVNTHTRGEADTPLLECNHLEKIRYRKILNYHMKKVDILFIQETHIDNITIAKQLEKDLNSKCFWSFGNNRSRGVGICINNRLNYIVKHFKFDFEGRIVSVDLDIDENRFRFVNIYAPNSHYDRKEFIELLENYIQTNRFVILGGDWNFVEKAELDRNTCNENIGTIGKLEIEKLKTDFKFTTRFENFIQHQKSLPGLIKRLNLD